MFKYLGPLTKSGYLRIGFMIVAFYFAVQWLTQSSRLDRSMLIEDLRETAQSLAEISDKQHYRVPTDLYVMKSRGLIDQDLLDRCKQANVNFYPENVTNRDGLPVFSVPGEKEGMTRVTAEGLVLR
jgi:hypothetical protein